MRNLVWDDFRDAVGTLYRVDTTDLSVTLSLDIAQPLAETHRDGGAFRLEFLGPISPALPQAIYKFTAEGVEPFEIFIVPVGTESHGVRYEAIFY